MSEYGCPLPGESLCWRHPVASLLLAFAIEIRLGRARER